MIASTDLFFPAEDGEEQKQIRHLKLELPKER